MKKSVLIFVIAFLVITTTVVWLWNSGFKSRDLLMAGCMAIIVVFAIYFGVKRVKSARRGEPAEDELSKKIMTRASSVSYFISIYFWLVMMYLSDKVKLETHTLIGAGIMGMAIILAVSWLVFYITGVKNE